MKTIVLAAAVLFAAAAPVAFSPAAFAASCAEAPEIRAAFEPRLDYEHERALRVAGNDADWPDSIRTKFEQIESDGLDCRAIYDRYNAFVDDVIARNDRLEEHSPKTRGLIFRKW
jgi:hypothetical protein